MSTALVPTPPVVRVPRRRGAAFGLGWSAATQLAATAIKLASTLVLTRLLAPDAYTLLGTALAVLTTLEWVSDLGVTPALVRNPRGDNRDWLLVGWWVNLGRGCLLALAAAAAPLAGFFGRPELVGVIAALAFQPVLAALRSPGVPLLRRRLEYRALFADEIAQTAVGAAAAAGTAYLFPGSEAWALVAGTMAAAGTGVASSYILAPMTPCWHWDREAAAQLAGFGGPVLVNTLVMAAWLNLDRLLGLKLLGAEAAGCYVVAWNLAAAAEAAITPGTDVYFGMLARRTAVDRIDWHRATAGRLTAVAGPVLAVGVAVAPAVVRVLYDRRYEPAGMVLAVMLARLVVRAAGQFDFQFLLAAGRVRAATAGYLVAAVLQGPLLFLLAGRYGACGAAAAGLLSTVAATAVQAIAARELGWHALRRAAVAGAWAAAGLLVAVAANGGVPR